MSVWRGILSALGLTSDADEPLLYHGLCDASAVVRLGDHIVVATDERNDADRNVLWIYRLGTPQGRTVTLDAVLGDKEGEADLEGVARLGDRLFWIGSHGANAAGEPKPRRQVLIATDLVMAAEGPQLTPTGTAYRTLLADLDADPHYAPFGLPAAATRAPETDSGLSIEGLAARDGALLIGLRGPLFDGRALVVTLLNPGDAIAGAPGRFGPPVFLELGGRGIRSLDEHPDGHIAVVAGNPGGGGNFALFDWTASGVVPGLALDFGGHRPEGLSVAADGSLLFVSDDGDEDGCKDKPDAAKRFRLFEVRPGG